jgi:hypothetical protein
MGRRIVAPTDAMPRRFFNARPSLDLYIAFGKCAGSGKTAVGGDQVQVGMADKG